MVGDANDENSFPHKLLFIQKLRGFVMLLQIIHQLLQNYQKLNYINQNTQEDF